MKRILFTLCLIALLMPLGAQQINWITNYDSAVERAEQTGQNILLLLTAPGWCTYCQWLEANTLKDPQVIDLINQGYIPCYITDENPQIDRFDFEGFPTLKAISSQGVELAQVPGAADSQTFMNVFSSHASQGRVVQGDPIKLYGRPSSERTQQLRSHFDSQGIYYEFYDVNDPAIKNEIKTAIENFGWRGTIYLPIMMIGDLIYFPPN